MDATELRKLIEELQTEIQYDQSIIERDHELLSQLESEIRKYLSRTGSNELDININSINHLKEKLKLFELTHPVLETLISQLLDALRKLGN